jgi:4-oxalocrotonate tautomerase
MPIIQFHLLEGRTVEQKRLLARRICDTVCEVLEVAPQSVRILINEMKKEEYSVAGITAADGGLGNRQVPNATNIPQDQSDD